jgi:minor histocompatibility antigen H13
LSYFGLFAIWGAAYFVVIPVPVNLILHSCLILYIGCHRSLNLLVPESEGGQATAEKEMLTAADAYKFPFIGSAALFSLYVVFKYFDKDTVNLVLSLYFSVIGVITLTTSFSSFFAIFISSPSKYGFKKTFPLIGEVDCMLTPAEIVCFLFSCVFGYYYFMTKHYMMNNILGISFCIQSIERISIGSYKIGAILLIGLFFYDIFWVFGTEVMVTVAKSFDGPIKLLFPRILPTLTEKGQFSLLGLGDIVIPGFFVSLMIRFDLVQSGIAKKGAELVTFAKPYFHTTLFAYAMGLVLTVGVMYFFEAAQPALLYLVPCCLLASLSVGMARGELGLLFAYDEEAANKLQKEQEEAANKKTE